MGVQNAATKNYMSRNDVFAALFNYYVYDGKQVLCKEFLTEVDSADSVLLSDNKGKRYVVEKYRDVLRTRQKHIMQCR